MIQRVFKRYFVAFCLGLFCTIGAHAAPLPEIYPTPKQVSVLGDNFTPVKGKTKWKLAESLDQTLTNELKTLLNGLKITIEAGTADDRQTSGYNIPQQAEGYYLHVTSKKIVLAGRDTRGVYYAFQSLKQLIIDKEEGIALASVEIQDWPDITFRGTVEGFYGKPWSHINRISQLRFYGKYKLNTYIYGPKDDPYHGFSNQWRDPYPADKAKQIGELVKEAKLNHVNYVWAVHPGRDIHWTDEDGDGVIDDFVACRKKFEMMYEIGVRSFAVFFDDISGEGTDASRQAEMLNYLNAQFIQQKPDVTSLIMCPTQYNRAWSGGDYLSILGENLDKDINIMWTGNSVCADITRDGMDWINEQIKRKAFIWWNWPVSDYVRTRLLLGRTYGLDVENAGTMSGFTSNPMDKPEASKIGLFGVADYTWNMDGFQSEKSWKAGIERLFPKVADAMICFASHNSDQGPNTHRYRREESVAIRPAMEAFAKQYLESGTISDVHYQAITNAFNEIRQAGKTLLAELPEINSAFYAETKNWISSFEALGKAGHTLMMNIQEEDASHTEQMQAINQVIGLLYRMDDFSRQQQLDGEPDPWAKGCETAATVVTPFVHEVLEKLLADFKGSLTGKQSANSSKDVQYYKVLTNVDALQSLQVVRDGKYIKINPILEVITLKPGEYLGIGLPLGICANYVHINLGNENIANQGAIELSANGENWKAISTNNMDENMQARISLDDNIRFARFMNTSNKKLEIKINLFKLDVPDEARVNTTELMHDGDMHTFYECPANKKHVDINSDQQTQSKYAYIIGDYEKATVYFTDGTTTKYNRLDDTNTKVIEKIRISNGQHSTRIHEVIWK